MVDADAARMAELRDKLMAAANELGGARKALVAARFDGTPLRDVEDPLLLADRLIQAIGPTVQEIALHSLAPSELVIKRLLGDDRREEIFVSKVELRERIRRAPESKRGLFEPLGLDDSEVVEQVSRPALSRPAPAAAAPPEVAQSLPKAVVQLEAEPTPTPAEVSAPGIPIEDHELVEAVENVVVAIEADAEPTNDPSDAR
jgi:hypothetical protein